MTRFLKYVFISNFCLLSPQFVIVVVVCLHWTTFGPKMYLFEGGS